MACAARVFVRMAYNAFLLLPLVTALYCIAMFVTERRVVWQALAFALAGTLLGFVLHPYTPNNILFTVQHLYPKFIQPTTANVGSEWSPYQTWTLVKNSGPALALWSSAQWDWDSAQSG